MEINPLQIIAIALTTIAAVLTISLFRKL